MREGYRAFVLVIVIPALGLALGGLRLLSVEAENARKIGKEALLSRATQAAAHIRKCARESPFRPRSKALLANLPRWLEETWTDEADGSQSETTMTACLRDKEGSVLFQLPDFRRNAFAVGARIGPEAPGVRVFVCWKDAAFRAGRMRTRIYLIGAVVILLLVTSLLGGAWMLVRHAREARQEARRQLDFTAAVSHEFKTPLTGILLAAEFAQGRVSDPAARQALTDVVEGAQRLSRLVADVLAAARFADDRRLPVDPTDVGDGVLALANRAALDHLLGNLRDNAAKYAPGTLEERVRAEGDLVFIDVMDRGPGLADDELRHVFENYWRGDRSVSRQTGGCGLGLPIARRLARMQGGDLTVAPRDGGGLIFTITLKKAEGTNG